MADKKHQEPTRQSPNDARTLEFCPDEARQGHFQGIFFRDRGDPEAPPLLCVHGLTRTGADFNHLAAELSGDRRIVSPDVAGRGRSRWLVDPQRYEVGQYAADLTALMDYLGLAQVDWLGTSMGGLIGLHLAARGRIRRLILNDVGPVLEPEGLQRIGSYLSRPFHFTSFEEGCRHHREIYAPFGALSDEQWEEMARSVLVQVPDGSYRYGYDPRIVEGRGSSDAGADWKAVQCPVLVLRGQHSDILSASTAAEMALRPGVQTREVPGVGHAATFLETSQIEFVRDFLA